MKLSLVPHAEIVPIGNGRCLGLPCGIVRHRLSPADLLPGVAENPRASLNLAIVRFHDVQEMLADPIDHPVATISRHLPALAFRTNAKSRDAVVAD